MRLHQLLELLLQRLLICFGEDLGILGNFGLDTGELFRVVFSFGTLSTGVISDSLKAHGEKAGGRLS